MDKNGKSNDAFWALADERVALKKELKALTRANGAPLGLSFGGWKSPKRRRAHAIAAELRDLDERFRGAQQQFAAAMRARAQAAASEMTTKLDAALTAQAVSGDHGEFAALRVGASDALAHVGAVERAMRRQAKAPPRFG